jgi:phosphate-selective porin
MEYVWVLQDYNDTTSIKVFNTKSAAKYYAENYYQSKRWDELNANYIDLYTKEFDCGTGQDEIKVVCGISKKEVIK